MEINDELIDKLGDLCKIEFSAEEREEMKNDLGRILGFVDKLKEVDMGEVEPLIHMTAELNRFREDEPSGEVSHEEALKNAPDADSDYFRVPKFSKK